MQARTCGEEQHVAAAGGLGDGGGDARLRAHATVAAPKLGRAHEAAASNVDDRVLVRELQQTLLARERRAQIEVLMTGSCMFLALASLGGTGLLHLYLWQEILIRVMLELSEIG